MTGQPILSIDDALDLPAQTIEAMHREYLNEGFVKILETYKINRQFVRAEGMRVWDDGGTEYLDFLCSYGALSLGHNHPAVLEAVRKASSSPNLLQITLSRVAAALASNLAAITPGDLVRSFFCNSGSEAVEGAIKLARIVTGRTRIVCAEEGFHGKTMGALSATGHEEHRAHYYPLVPGFSHVPFGSIEALADELSAGDVAAVMLEPIQGPAGIRVPPDGYLTGVRELCSKHGALMMLDEIQTGFGRTGKMFACQHEEVVPDVLCISKALGGGVFPIGAYVTSDAVWRKAYGSPKTCLLHTSTFGGNTLACAAGVAAIKILVEEKLDARAAELGPYFAGRLREVAAHSKLLHEVRGRGLMIGLDFEQASGIKDKLTGGLLNTTAAMVATELLSRYNIICLYTFNNPRVIRLAPPLNCAREDLDRFVEGLDLLLSESKGFARLAMKSIGRIIGGG